MLCHAVAILLTCLAVSRGVATIEPVNKVTIYSALGGLFIDA